MFSKYGFIIFLDDFFDLELIWEHLDYKFEFQPLDLVFLWFLWPLVFSMVDLKQSKINACPLCNLRPRNGVILDFQQYLLNRNIGRVFFVLIIFQWLTVLFYVTRQSIIPTFHISPRLGISSFILWIRSTNTLIRIHFISSALNPKI